MIGERIKELRKEKGLLQRELAEELNITQQTISLYESEKRYPDAKSLNKMAKYFDVSIDYLLGNTDERQKADHIKQALSDDPELLEFWDEMNEREDLRMYFKKCSELSPETIKKLIHISKVFEEEERERHGG
ncbi:MAG: helix-turn-helix domain-containing protein [Candidatus Frackibacter sp. T328-2]|nr:MAG: helix-turn-helix domain-containing protein [Candidatus Frackibacter sp. T328-2]